MVKTKLRTKQYFGINEEDVAKPGVNYMTIGRESRFKGIGQVILSIILTVFFIFNLNHGVLSPLDRLLTESFDWGLLTYLVIILIVIFALTIFLFLWGWDNILSCIIVTGNYLEYHTLITIQYISWKNLNSLIVEYSLATEIKSASLWNIMEARRGKSAEDIKGTVTLKFEHDGEKDSRPYGGINPLTLERFLNSVGTILEIAPEHDKKENFFGKDFKWTWKLGK